MAGPFDFLNSFTTGGEDESQLNTRPALSSRGHGAPQQRGGSQGWEEGSCPRPRAWAITPSPQGPFPRPASGRDSVSVRTSPGVPRRPPLAHTHHMPVAGQRDEDVAAFMDQQFAVDALVTMPRETPYPFAALATVRSLRVTTSAIELGPRHYPKPAPH